MMSICPKQVFLAFNLSNKMSKVMTEGKKTPDEVGTSDMMKNKSLIKSKKLGKQAKLD